MGFVLLILVVFAFVLLPLLILKTILHVTLGLAVLPFKLLGVLARIFGVFLKIAVAGVGLFVGVLALVMGIVLLPLLPLFVLAGILWLAVRAVSPRPAGRLA